MITTRQSKGTPLTISEIDGNFTFLSNSANSAFAATNSANSVAVSAFAAANSANSVAVSANKAANSANSVAISAYNAANSTLIATNSANSVAISAFAAANSANSVGVSANRAANSANSVAISAYNAANSANSVAISAYNAANSANSFFSNILTETETRTLINSPLQVHAEGKFAFRPTANAVLNGLCYRSQDTGIISIIAGGVWSNQTSTAYRIDSCGVNVKSCGAYGDGVADDTVAIQLAINIASVTGKVVWIPAGIYKVTSELVISAPTTIRGERPAYDYSGSLLTKGSYIVSYNNVANSAIFRVTNSVGTYWPTTKFLEFDSFGMGYNVSSANMHGVIIDSDISYGGFRRVHFQKVGGTAILFMDGRYHHNLYIRDTLINACGQAIGNMGTTLACTLLTIDNVAVEASGQGYSGLHAIMDLRVFREINIGNLVLEGSCVVRPNTALSISCDSWVKIAGLHIEYGGSYAPTYAIDIDDYCSYEHNNPILQIGAMYLGSALTGNQIRINTPTLVRPVFVKIDHVIDWTVTVFEDLFEIVSGSRVYIDVTAGTNALVKFPLSLHGRVKFQSIQLAGSAQHLQQGKSSVLLESSRDNLFIIPAATYTSKWAERRVSTVNSTTATIVTDTTLNARVLKLQSATGTLPYFGLRVTLPSDYDGSIITFVAYYRIVTNSTWNFNFLYNDADTSSAVGQNIKDGTWNWAVTQIRYSSASNQRYAYSLLTSGTPTDAPEVYVAAFGIIIGNELIYPKLVPSDTTLNCFSATAPTAGDWIVGDKLWVPAPAANTTPGRICVTAGSPGTWKDMAVLSG